MSKWVSHFSGMSSGKTVANSNVYCSVDWAGLSVEFRPPTATRIALNDFSLAMDATKASVRRLYGTGAVFILGEAMSGSSHEEMLWWNPWSPRFAVFGKAEFYQKLVDTQDSTLAARLKTEAWAAYPSAAPFV